MNNKIIDHMAEIIGEDSTVKEAARIMAEHDVGSIAVINKDESLIVGTLSESDINDKVLIKGKDISTTKTAEIMSRITYREKPGTDEILVSMANKGSIDL